MNISEIPDKYKSIAERPQTLVVVDDEEYILMSLKRLLRQCRYKKFFFTSPVEALSFISENPADVIISDMRMPEMPGTEFLERVVECNSENIRIIISGYEEKSVIFNAISRGLARNYIMKPWDDEDLKKIIDDSMVLSGKLKQKRMMNMLDNFNRMPCRSRINAKLKEMIQREHSSQKEISAEIEKHPELAVLLLRMSNSIFYGSRRAINNIFDAISLIGIDEVLQLIISIESFGVLVLNLPENEKKKLETLFLRFALRAKVAREIAVKWYTSLDPGEVYAAALLADIGLVYSMASNPEKLNEFCRQLDKSDESILAADKKIYEISHTEVGELLLTFWNFPLAIISAAEGHHNRFIKDDLSIIVQMADEIIFKEQSHPHSSEASELANRWIQEYPDGFES